MSTAAEATTSSGNIPSSALLIELEGAALPARAVLFETAQKYFKKQGVALTEAHFARCAGPVSQLAAQLTALLAPDSESGDLAAVLNRALADRFASRAELAAGLAKILKVAEQRGVSIAVLTGLPEIVAQAIFSAAGFDDRGIQTFVFSEDEKGFPRADAWLKVAKQLGKNPRFCIAFGSSHTACKSALSAGMRTIAVPDAYTGHHDFSGSDLVVDSWDDVSATELLDTLLPPLR
ncbi:MAG: HAD family phosphatase [Kiritimatiellae bacterium]|nr:HAD family phosphatase [Kiritimatiellia bacterium]MCO5067951.1 HAD family phosphatase [Kiritimatiellia bacterium]